MPKTISGHSHVPSIAKGVYTVGGTVTGRMGYNQSPVSWNVTRRSADVTNAVRQALAAGQKMKELEMLKEFFGESMCGDCISIKVTGGHDRNVHKRRRCQLCGTLWPGLEPDNDRRGAIEAQKARKNPFHCSSCQDVGCALCL